MARLCLRNSSRRNYSKWQTRQSFRKHWTKVKKDLMLFSAKIWDLAIPSTSQLSLMIPSSTSSWIINLLAQSWPTLPESIKLLSIWTRKLTRSSETPGSSASIPDLYRKSEETELLTLLRLKRSRRSKKIMLLKNKDQQNLSKNCKDRKSNMLKTLIICSKRLLLTSKSQRQLLDSHNRSKTPTMICCVLLFPLIKAW